MSVLFETSLGSFTVDLYLEARPRCCQNFLKLCKLKYYNFCLFYSIQKNLVAQTGDPTNSGHGGSSIFEQIYGEQARYFDAELKPRIKHRRSGLLSMVNNGEGRHGSQFFITLSDNVDYLDGVHTIFGEISEGYEEIIPLLNEAYCDTQHRPYRDLRIYHTIVLDDPTPDIPSLEFPSRSPSPTQSIYDAEKRLFIEDYEANLTDLPLEELHEEEEQKEAKANAQILEMIGDLPSIDVKPPDNVLFVCKLNPVTTSEDLEIIFSRFGEILSCEVIRDQKTGNSLQYAFIEFEKENECESAYLKMENVLIDERRIHVDFSQSVAKEWQNYRKGHISQPSNMQEDQNKDRRQEKISSRSDDNRDDRSRPHAKVIPHKRERERSRDEHMYKDRKRSYPYSARDEFRKERGAAVDRRSYHSPDERRKKRIDDKHDHKRNESHKSSRSRRHSRSHSRSRDHNKHTKSHHKRK